MPQQFRIVFGSVANEQPAQEADSRTRLLIERWAGDVVPVRHAAPPTRAKTGTSRKTLFIGMETRTKRQSRGTVKGSGRSP
jgi:hypothetical protein